MDARRGFGGGVRMVAAGLLGLAGLVSLVGGCRRGPPAGDAETTTAEQNLNVLLITVDTTRADCLRCYGHPVVRTPAIDKLAVEGALFTQCTSCAPITLPSHASILTGVYPFVHGARVNGQQFDDEGNVTLAEILKPVGFTTGAEVAAFVLDASWGVDQGFDTFGSVPEPPAGQAPHERPIARGLIAAEPGDRVCDRALAWLNEHGTGRFFLWVHFFDPHYPYEPPEPFKSEYESPYLGEIAFMDQQIGRLMTRLKELKLHRRTLVALVGDHGEGFTDHREGTHMYFVYDSTLHVPLIFWCPGKVPEGRRIDAQVRTVDVTPTLLDLLDRPPKADAQGVSLVPLLTGAADDLNLAAYGETMEPHLTLGYAQLRCLRVGGWKYVHAPTPELYNVIDDPGELVNLASQHPDRVEDMREQLRALIADAVPRIPRGGPTVPLDPEAARRLAALGYVGDTTAEVGDELNGFDDLVGYDPKDRMDQRNFFMAAKAYLADGMSDKATPILERLVQAEPENPGFLSLLGAAQQSRGDIEEAITSYRRVLETRPQTVGIRVMLGKLLGELGRVDEAVEHLRAAAEEAPTYPDAQTYLALALAKLGRCDEAVQRFERALAVAPADEAALLGLSGTLQACGKRRRAINVLREGLRQCPGSLSLANNLAWSLATAPDAELRDGAEAVRVAEALHERAQGDHAEILDTLAAAYAEAGRFEEAVGAARRAIEAALSSGQSESAAQIQSRLALYEAGQAYHEEP